MTDLRLQGFGSSARRGQTAWTDPAPWQALMDAAAPAHVAHGASPSGGADAVIDEVSRAWYRAHGWRPDQHVHAFPMRRDLDGEGGGAFLRRNGRTLELFRPNVAAGLVVGRVGQAVGTRGCYLSNGSEDMARRLRAAKVPLVIYREDGVEPCPVARAETPLVGALLGACLALGALFEQGLFAEDVGRAGVVVKQAMLVAKERRHESRIVDALMGARAAVEALREGQPRIAPWVAPVEARLRML